MKRFLAIIILASTFLNSCGRNNISANYILPADNIQISSTGSEVGSDSAIKYGTVMESSFIKDVNGDHYRFNHLSIKYITDTDLTDRLSLAYSLDNQGVVFIWLTHNPGTPDEKQEMIDSGNRETRTAMAEMLKTLRTLNNKDKVNVSLTVNVLLDDYRNRSLTNKYIQSQLMKIK